MAKFTTPAGSEYNYEIIKRTSIIRTYRKKGKKPEKYKKCIELLRYKDKKTGKFLNDYAIRFGYYRYNKKLKRWVWGQYTLVISHKEWLDLFKKANKENIFSKSYKRSW
jgi:2-succinyl-5-enolpyruvyl-6-hydroxy-3-cyclohexene-1-carboxylate synthase